ncbi:hypothetical protein V2I01_35280 [Micromonospora sp. BRA006-A]|nr:hypothetical protein [Micromonospora sp. BRA006-A]
MAGVRWAQRPARGVRGPSCQEVTVEERTPRPDELDPVERIGVDELRALQLDRLRHSLRHAYDDVPHYRHAFDALGAHPDDLREPADLARFPFTTKAELRENYPFGMFAVPRERVARLHASSGTTGRPTVVGYTRARPRHLGEAHGPLDPRRRGPPRRPGARRVRLRAVHRRARRALRRRGVGLHRRPGLRRHDRASGHADPRPRTGGRHGDPELHARHRGRDGTPGRRPRATSLRVGVFGAEPWTEDMRRELEQRLDMHALDIYGLSEVMGPGWRSSAWRPGTACTCGRTTSTRRSSIRSPRRCCPTGSGASWC